MSGLSLSEAIAQVPDLDNLSVVEGAIQDLLRARRRKILELRRKLGEPVGFIYTKRGFPPVACNALIEKFYGKGIAICQVIAPMRFASQEVKIDLDLLREKMNVVERVETDLVQGEESGPEEDEGEGVAGDDPLSGAFG